MAFIMLGRHLARGHHHWPLKIIGTWSSDDNCSCHHNGHVSMIFNGQWWWWHWLKVAPAFWRPFGINFKENNSCILADTCRNHINCKGHKTNKCSQLTYTYWCQPLCHGCTPGIYECMLLSCMWNGSRTFYPTDISPLDKSLPDNPPPWTSPLITPPGITLHVPPYHKKHFW